MKREQRIVLVTGASSGIGFCLAEELAKDGNRVYAGVRKSEDVKRLSEKENITGIRLDITCPEQIQEAVRKIEEEEGCLDVLINNAGVTGWGAVMDRDMEYFRRVMDVNYFGHVQMIKESYPLLKKSVKNPIIINISSQAGNYAFPYWSVYHSSKWAIEAFSHCLRRELLPFGVRVAIVQPGAIESQAFSKDKDDFERYQRQENSDFTKYGMLVLDAAFHRKPLTRDKSPLLVAKVVRKAVYGKKNAIYYQPGRRFLPDFVAGRLSYRAVDRFFQGAFQKLK